MNAPNAVARAERAALADLLLEVGPTAPTLCGGWDARDLAAHIVLRERRPDAAGGILLGVLKTRMERVQAALAGQPWEQLVATLREGPPSWSPVRMPAVDAQVNTIEFFVHHEDVRRGVAGWTPRALDEATVETLWKHAATTGKFLARACPVGVLLAPGDGPAAGSIVRVRAGIPEVTLVGPVGEIVLSLFGRVTQGLEIQGPASARDAFLAYPR